MIKVGQIYKQQNGEFFVITQIFHLKYMSVIYPDGYVQVYDLEEKNQDFLFHKKIASASSLTNAISLYPISLYPISSYSFYSTVTITL